MNGFLTDSSGTLVYTQLHNSGRCRSIGRWCWRLPTCFASPCGCRAAWGNSCKRTENADTPGWFFFVGFGGCRLRGRRLGLREGRIVGFLGFSSIGFGTYYCIRWVRAPTQGDELLLDGGLLKLGGAEEARAALRLESHRPECRSLQVEVCQSSPGTCTESGEGSGGSWRVCAPATWGRLTAMADMVSGSVQFKGLESSRACCATMMWVLLITYCSRFWVTRVFGFGPLPVVSRSLQKV